MGSLASHSTLSSKPQIPGRDPASENMMAVQEMAQWLRTLAVLPESLGSVHRHLSLQS